MKPQVFISYKRDHAPSETVVREIERALGEDFVFLRDQNMAPGVPWSAELYKWLLGCDAGIAVIGKEAAAADWCRREWALLAARNRTAALPVVPVHIEPKFVETGVLDDLQGLLWNAEAIDALRARLANLPARPPAAEDFLAAHMAWLRWQYQEAPVLGQEPYALADVYIETECGRLAWSDINETKAGTRSDAFKPTEGGRHPLLETVLDRFADPAFRDLVVVQAGPGSGKSAFTLRLAHRLADEGFMPVVVRFRDLRLATFPDVGELIDDAIRIGDSNDDSPHPGQPIVRELLAKTHVFRGTKLCKAVFILDGWDEVSLTGNVSYQAQLREWLPRLREYFGRRTPVVRVLLTGRPSAEVGLSGVLHRDTPVLTMRAMRPFQLRQYASAIRRHLVGARTGGRDTHWSIDLARLEPVFADYGAWFEQAESGEPPADAKAASMEVLGNPLLAYLSLRVMAESVVDIQALLQEPTALYHALIEATARHAGKGHDAGLEQAVHRGGERLRRLLQEVAATISILRAESVSYRELAARLGDSELPIDRELLDRWAVDTRSTENALRELVVNFYFKGGNTELGCEFLHKSFREYLFAEAIVAAIDDAAPQGVRLEGASDARDAYARDFAPGTAEYKASRRLAYLLAPQWMSSEVERHVAWLLERQVLADRERWTLLRDLVTNIYAWWAEGVHLRHQSSRSQVTGRWSAPYVDLLFAQAVPLDDPERRTVPIRTTSLDAHLGHALMRIGCILHSLARDPSGAPSGRRAQYQSVERGQVRFRPGGGFMNALVARVNAEGWRALALGSLVSGPVDLTEEYLYAANAFGTDLEGAVFDRALLDQSHFSYARLRGSSFRGAVLSGGRLVGCDLFGANLRDATLKDANLEQANLVDANLRGALLRNANLAEADMRNANLEGAGLSGANLEQTRVARAQLLSAVGHEAALGQPHFVGEQSRTDGS